MVTTYIRAKDQGQRPFGAKDRVETKGRTDEADCITFLTNAVGNYEQQIYYRNTIVSGRRCLAQILFGYNLKRSVRSFGSVVCDDVTTKFINEQKCFVPKKSHGYFYRDLTELRSN